MRSRTRTRPVRRPDSARSTKLLPPRTVPSDQVNGNSFPIVGIGASAGGLEAFTELLRPLPTDTGMAFVLIQHLAPDHKSLLSDILSRKTRLPVSEVKDKTTVEPNHVYVIPPDRSMSIHNGVLILTGRKDTAGPFMPIDHFLLSLAADRHTNAIAVILSGGDGDGSHALEAIKAEGGITFAQEANSAGTGSMPEHAMATGLVDFVLPPEKIAKELVRIARDPTAIRLRKAPAEEVLPKDEGLATIYSLLNRARGVDFTYYKQATLKRRIARRMIVQKVSSLREYVKVLKNSKDEVAALYDDILIHVTEFFRDPETFKVLKSVVFPHLMKKRATHDAFRIWVPGCSSGEEVYSIVICLMEFLGEETSRPAIQVFATDISDKTLLKARKGIYPEAALARVSMERRGKFFNAVAGGYQINQSVQDLCVFAKQNVAKDPPFSKLDLISCRNLLIYLGPELQKRVTAVFNYALKPAGILLLGASETLTTFSDLFSPFLFSPLNKQVKLYTKKSVSVGQHPLFSRANYPVIKPLSQPLKDRAESLDGTSLLKEEADLYVLEKRAPAGIIVDGVMNIVQFRGPISRYLEVAAGTASLNLFRLAKEGLLLELRPAILKAKKKKSAVRIDGSRIKSEGRYKNVSIEVVPLTHAPSGEPHFLILFQEDFTALPPKGKLSKVGRHSFGSASSRAAEAEIIRLKKEQAANRAYLHSIVSEQEIINEELKAANEEALSSNEEFQSANEELETAKEELQATNEETNTLNEELNSRNLDLTNLNNDLINLMANANVPIVILGKDHHIRRLTPAAEKMLAIGRVDIGRSIHDLKLAITVKDLNTMITSVLTALVPEQREVQDIHGHWYNMRVQLYRTLDDKIDGVVFSFLDIQMAKERQTAAANWAAELEAKVKQRTEELTQTQNALHQAEKLEAIGRLAGGVAHDFNNLMTGILGITEGLQRELGPESTHRTDLEDILGAAKKATVITKQLLAFGRRQLVNPQVLNLNQMIGSMDGLFRRLLGEDIEVKTVLAADLGSVRIDPGNLEQVILNLGLNARDSMLTGGKLTVKTANVELGEDYVKRHFSVKPGPYVALSVSDTGSGMTAETLDHMFEPFFTTKGGKGTGLGLANVYGIVKQANGDIVVDSERGQGTVFKIYFPRVEKVPDIDRRSFEGTAAPGGAETILVTEDEDIVRKVTVRALRAKGYTVLDARNAQEAIKISEERSESIDLLLTDIIMPGMNGHELAKLITTRRPSVTVLYMSGYNREIIAQRGVLDPGTNFIEKTFTSEGLCHKVRRVLDARRPAGAGS